MSRLSIALALVALLALPGAAPAGEKYALVVGVDRYRETELSSLDFAAADAIRLGAALERLGFDVITMTPQADRVSLRPDGPRDILESLDRRLKFRDRNDTIVVALSGHGVQLVGDAATPEGTRETWFCPAKARLDDRGTLLAISEVIRRMGACPAARKLLLVDACRNDMTPPGAGKPPDVIVEELDPAAPARRLIPDGMVALFSCSSQERSFERKELGHSLFSYHVIRYLEGAADDPARWYERGEATLTDLVAYAQKRTARSAEDLAADQTPELVGRMTNWSFGRVGGDLASVDRKPAMDRPLPTVPPVPPVPKPFAGRKPVAGSIASLKLPNGAALPMCWIPAGRAMLGSPSDEPQRELGGLPENEFEYTTAGFWMAQTETTVEQWAGIVDRRIVGDSRLPVTSISFTDMQAAVERLNQDPAIQEAAGRLLGTGRFRLPDEDQWEYACRGGKGNQTAFYWGNSANGREANLNGSHPYPRGTPAGPNVRQAKPVGAYADVAPHPWKLMDMHGNVWEYCRNRAEQRRPIVKGGSYFDPGIWQCRAAYRDEQDPSSRSANFGFRLSYAP